MEGQEVKSEERSSDRHRTWEAEIEIGERRRHVRQKQQERKRESKKMKRNDRETEEKREEREKEVLGGRRNKIYLSQFFLKI